MRINCLLVGHVFEWIAMGENKLILSQEVKEDGPKSSEWSYSSRRILITAVFMRTTTINHHKDRPLRETPDTRLFCQWIHKTAKRTTQDYKLLDFNTTSKMTNPSVVGNARRKTQKQEVICHFWCASWLTIYTDSFLSSTGVFTIEAVSVCADITVCAEDDCAMSHIF